MDVNMGKSSFFFSSCEFSVRPKLSFDREWGTHRITGWCRMGQAPTCLAFHCSGSLRTFLAESSALRLVFSGPPTPQTSILLCYLNEIWLSFYFDCRFFFLIIILIWNFKHWLYTSQIWFSEKINKIIWLLMILLQNQWVRFF